MSINKPLSTRLIDGAMCLAGKGSKGSDAEDADARPAKAEKKDRQHPGLWHCQENRDTTREPTRAREKPMVELPRESNHF